MFECAWCIEAWIFRWPDISEEEAKYRAKIVALSAIKFYILVFSPQSTVLFDSQKSIEFNGRTGE